MERRLRNIASKEKRLMDSEVAARVALREGLSPTEYTQVVK